MLSSWHEACYNDLLNLRSKSPLVHNITNFVVMNSSANILLAIGAQPVMAHAISEVEEMVGIADALVLNIGTLDESWVKAMILAGKTANRRGIPVVFDPVGAGATRLRTTKSIEILDHVKISVLRGNASEISAIAGFEGARGVDSVHNVEDIIEISIELAERYSCIVGVSGEKDLITNGKSLFRVANGHHMMTRVTGTGCGLSAVIGAFTGISENILNSVVSGFALYGLAGELAFQRAQYPGSFSFEFIDALSRLDRNDIELINIQEVTL